jgi:hypothetical protein
VHGVLLLRVGTGEAQGIRVLVEAALALALGDHQIGILDARVHVLGVVLQYLLEHLHRARIGGIDALGRDRERIFRPVGLGRGGVAASRCRPAPTQVGQPTSASRRARTSARLRISSPTPPNEPRAASIRSRTAWQCDSRPIRAGHNATPCYNFALSPPFHAFPRAPDPHPPQASSMSATAALPPIDQTYTLEDKYTRSEGRIYLSGVQALVRLPLMQQMRDRTPPGSTPAASFPAIAARRWAASTWSCGRQEAPRCIRKVQFTPGLNEDLGATMVWGTQQTNLFPGATVDGVFSMWYGKGPAWIAAATCSSTAMPPAPRAWRRAGPGRRRPCLPLLHLAARLGTGVRLGDDAGAESGRCAGHPRHGPARLGDVALHGALGRLQDHCRNGRILRLGGRRSASVAHRTAGRFRYARRRLEHPLAGSAAGPGNAPASLRGGKAAQAFARANKHRQSIVLDSPRARFGIVTTGKSYLDVLQALEYLGIDEKVAADIGIRVYKVGMTWPLEPQGIRNASRAAWKTSWSSKKSAPSSSRR